jgi:uncharacterized membrane protein
VLTNADDAFARRSGGRIGGGSFRTPTRSVPRSGNYGSPRGSYGGGGFGFPFLIPFFSFGGFGSLFSILIVIAIANFVIRAFQNVGAGAGNGNNQYGYSKVSVAKVQVGLLATARELQNELDQLALSADTGTSEGRVTVCQEASLALLRHPEYWVYGNTESTLAGIDEAESKFNQLSLAERSKFSEETLSNVDNRLLNENISQIDGDLVKSELDRESGDYIIVTIIVGVIGKFELAEINSTNDTRQALQQIGGLGGDRLLAIEVLWTPQAEGDTLSQDDIISYYPDLRLI